MSFANLLSLLLVIAIACTLWQWTRLRVPRPLLYRLLGLLVVLALFTEVTGGIMRQLFLGNDVLYNVFALTELLLVLGMAYALHPAWKAWLAAAGGAGVAAMGLCLWGHTGTGFLLTEGIVTIALLLTAVCLAVLWRLAQESRESLVKVPEFWLFMGMLFYFGGMPPLMGVVRHIYDSDPQLARQLYSIIPMLCIVRYLLTAVACHMAAKVPRQTRDA